MPITLTVKTDDPQVEKLFGFLKSEFPWSDAYEKINILERCVQWMRIVNDDNTLNFDGKSRIDLRIVIEDLPAPAGKPKKKAAVQREKK
jgi:hypothetical protein